MLFNCYFHHKSHYQNYTLNILVDLFHSQSYASLSWSLNWTMNTKLKVLNTFQFLPLLMFSPIRSTETDHIASIILRCIVDRKVNHLIYYTKQPPYLKAVVIISVLMLDSRESKVTLHNTYREQKNTRLTSTLLKILQEHFYSRKSNIHPYNLSIYMFYLLYSNLLPF